MKLSYIANMRLPTEKAHGIQIMKMCEAFANQGVDVELIVPRRFNHIEENPFSYYGVKQNFTITRLPTIDLMPVSSGWLKKVAYWLNYLIFSELSFWYCLFSSTDVYYSRNELPLLYLSIWKDNVFWEVHKLSNNSLKKYLIKLLSSFAEGVISTNEWKLEKLKDQEMDFENNLIAPNGVDISNFDIDISKLEARQKVDLPQDKEIVMYTGHLYEWKGVYVLAEAAKQLPEDYLVVFVGGTDDDVRKFRNKYEKVDTIQIEGWVPHEDIPQYLKASDILVLPNVPKTREAKLETSPIKMFEYMTSKRPIIAARLSSIQEVLDNKSSFLFRPGDPSSLVNTICKASNNPQKSNNRSVNAFEKVKKLTWRKRAANIISFINYQIRQ